MRSYLVTCLLLTASVSSLARAETIVSLTFDDGFSDHVQAAALLERYGMRGTFYVISHRLGRSGYLTLAELRAIAAAGHEIGGHTLNHYRLTEVSTAAAEREICDDRAQLFAFGFEPVTLAWPFGEDNQTAHALALKCGYLAARDVGGLRIDPICPRCPYGEFLPPPAPMVVRTPGSIRQDTGLATLQSLVLGSEAEGNNVLPLVVHRICDRCTEYSIRTEDLEAFLAWLAPRAANGTVVRPMREALEIDEVPPPPTPIGPLRGEPPVDGAPKPDPAIDDTGGCRCVTAPAANLWALFFGLAVWVRRRTWR